MRLSEPSRDDYESFCEARRLLDKNFDYERYVKEKTRWERRGKCKRCGRCCTARGLITSKLHGKERAWVGERELMAQIVEKFGEEGRELGEAILSIVCPHLKIIKRQAGRKDKAVCKIYKNRPDFCKKFPELPSEVVEGCGFYFIKKKEGENERQRIK